MPNPRIQIALCLSSWGIRSYDCFVDGEHVGNYKKKAEAVKAGEARIESLVEKEKQTLEMDQLEFGDV